MAIKFLDLHKQYLSIQDDIDAAIKRVIANSAFIGGVEVNAFEEEFGEFLGGGVKTLGVGNGTDALEIAIEALKLPKESEVLIPANTFAASIEAVIRNGLKAVFVDCANDYTLDIQDLKSKITSQTSAIMAVHLYGQSADMASIMELAQIHSLKVIEDCAQAHGATYRQQKVGTFGDIATFSFYPGKNLGAYGDGGMIVSKDSSLLQACRKIAHHGGLQKYEHEIVGRNSRLDGLQAAILRVKLKHLPLWNQRRREIATLYASLLEHAPVILPVCKPECECVWHLFVIRTPKRQELITALKAQGIQTGLHYPIALPHCPAYQNSPLAIHTQTKNATAWQHEILSLPMGEHLSDDEVREVARVILSMTPHTASNEA